MTPKEKAEELVEAMLGDNNHYLNNNIEIDKIHAKKCALIAVDEILDIVNTIYDCDAQVLYPYWEKVKQEIKGGEQ